MKELRKRMDRQLFFSEAAAENGPSLENKREIALCSLAIVCLAEEHKKLSLLLFPKRARPLMEKKRVTFPHQAKRPRK